MFEDGAAPIINIVVPSTVALEGSLETEAYMLDVGKCTLTQLEQIAEIIAKRRGSPFDPEERQQIISDVMAQMHERGMPIRASQVDSVSTDRPFFL